MTLTKRSWLLAGTLTAAAAGLGAAALVTQPGCASNCGSDCPPSFVWVGSTDNVELSINNIVGSGPACPPPEGLYCVGDQSTTSCTHFTVTGQAEGDCNVTVLFADRPAEILHLQFGPPIQTGCCHGYSLISDPVYVIPDTPSGGLIYAADGGSTTAVTEIVDGGTDASTDAATTP